MILVNTKRRILQYLEYKHVDRKEFYEKTGIKRGLLDADKLDASVSDTYIAKILVIYTDINPDWLVLGQGNMLRMLPFEQFSQSELFQQQSDVVALLKEQLKEKDIEIKSLNQEVGALKSQLKNKGMGLDPGLSQPNPSLSHSRDVLSEHAHL